MSHDAVRHVHEVRGVDEGVRCHGHVRGLRRHGDGLRWHESVQDRMRHVPNVVVTTAAAGGISRAGEALRVRVCFAAIVAQGTEAEMETVKLK